MLNEAQERSLSVTLRIVEDRLREIEQFIDAGDYMGILTEIKNDVPALAKDEIHEKAAQTRKKIKHLAVLFNLEKERTEASTQAFARLSYCWEILEDARSKRLKRFGDVHEGLPGVEEPLVDVVGDGQDVGMALDHRRQRLEVLPGEDRAGRIARAVEDDCPRPRRDGPGERGGVGVEPVLHPRGDDDRAPPGEEHLLRVAHPVGGEHHHLVPVGEQRLEAVVEGLLAAVGGDDLLGGEVELVLLLQLLDDGRAELGDAGGGGVLGEALPQRLDRRLLDVGRGVEVRLSRRQPGDVLPRGGEGLGPGVEGEGGRWLDVGEAAGELHDPPVPARPDVTQGQEGHGREACPPGTSTQQPLVLRQPGQARLGPLEALAERPLLEALAVAQRPGDVPERQAVVHPEDEQVLVLERERERGAKSLQRVQPAVAGDRRRPAHLRRDATRLGGGQAPPLSPPTLLAEPDRLADVQPPRTDGRAVTGHPEGSDLRQRVVDLGGKTLGQMGSLLPWREALEGEDRDRLAVELDRDRPGGEVPEGEQRGETGEGRHRPEAARPAPGLSLREELEQILERRAGIRVTILGSPRQHPPEHPGQPGGPHRRPRCARETVLGGCPPTIVQRSAPSA